MKTQVQKVLQQYYRARGWDEATGIPSPEKLRELGLDPLVLGAKEADYEQTVNC